MADEDRPLGWEDEEESPFPLPHDGRTQADLERIFGSVLTKAFVDHWQYELMLTNGQVIQFYEAQPYGSETWVHLKGSRAKEIYIADSLKDARASRGEMCERGVDIRLSQIVWVRDMGH